MKKVAAAFLFLVSSLFAQAPAPSWVQESARSKEYPPNEWYVGFAEDKLPRGANVSEAIRRLERVAQGRMIERITANVTTTSMDRISRRAGQQGKKFEEEIKEEFERITRVEGGAHVIGMETRSYHDAPNNKIYAIATTNRDVLANYYASRIEAPLRDAQRGVDLAKQFASIPKWDESFNELGKGRQRIKFADTSSAVSYNKGWLEIVDTKNRSQNWDVRKHALEKLIITTQAEVELAKKAYEDSIAAITKAKKIYVTGTENMLGQTVDVVTSGLRTLLSQNNFGIANGENEADYIIRIEASLCNTRASDHFQYASACVKVTLSNAKTNKQEHYASFTGPKQGGRDERNAADKAFKAVVTKVWDEVKGRM